MHKIVSLIYLFIYFHCEAEKLQRHGEKKLTCDNSQEQLFPNFFTIFIVERPESIMFGNIIHISKLENLIKIFGFKGC